MSDHTLAHDFAAELKADDDYQLLLKQQMQDARHKQPPPVDSAADFAARHGISLMQIEPTLVKRDCGGWLAVTPADSPLSFAVVAETTEEARKEFGVAAERWQAAADRAAVSGL